MEADKSCPIVLRGRETLEILAFEHPLAGFQLVKGSVEPGESSDLAAVRELKEEAGIQSTVERHLGQRRCSVTGYTWAFHECHVAQHLPDTWMHFAEDDGGHEFRFFWHPLVSELELPDSKGCCERATIIGETDWHKAYLVHRVVNGHAQENR